MATSDTLQRELDRFMAGVKHRNPGEHEFHQAVCEVAESVLPIVLDDRRYRDMRILERLTEPDRIITFRVAWQDDRGAVQVNRAWRVQFSNAIGPYKGGMRFDPSVTLSVLKFLGFEQVFKNSLTGLPMGGAKGGSNFDPKGKSDGEVMRFCQGVMNELHHHIGQDTDVPAGDMGVGSREISYMFGQYKRLVNRFEGTLTGKGLAFGGSRVRTEATGYGAVYFMRNMLARVGEGLEGRTAAVSGSGNVALYCVEKLIETGTRVVTLSDSGGFVHDPEGIDAEKLEWLHDLKQVRRGRIREYAEHFDGVTFHEGERPWSVPVDLAFPCATQNELDGDDAETLIDQGVRAVAEGANMPSTLEAMHRFRDAGVLFGPGKAANAGGVAVSGLEQSQNALRMSWSRDRVDRHLRNIMSEIHAKCVEHGADGDRVDYVRGANIAGFLKVADALLAYGVV
ncbi:MAG: NADP-specific glutamate dehydrogenase [Myxococcota bacterium]